jgi:hypothetical protein
MPRVDAVGQFPAHRGSQPADSAAAIRGELKRMFESSAFRTSRRSRLFLEYVVDKALAGHFDELKERVIGSALFGRPADYDTGTDSIVRVVANQTRRRIETYYAQTQNAGDLRIELPAGSYLPLIHHHHAPQAPDPPAGGPAIPLLAARREAETPPQTHGRPLAVRWLGPASVLLSAAICLVLIAGHHGLLRPRPTGDPTDAAGVIQPWSALFTGNRGLQIVLGDTSVGTIQTLLKRQLPLAEYANRRYIPLGERKEEEISPELQRVFRLLLATEYTSAAYAATAVRIAQLAQSHSIPVSVAFARDMSVRSVQGGGNFVILGTTRANPWAQLLDPYLNFTVEFSADRNEPALRNRAPRPGEDSIYAPGSGPLPTTTDSYGHIAFLPSLFKGGHFLLVTGTRAAAAEAAGELVTNGNRLRAALVKLGADPFGKPRPFEVLLRVRVTSSAPIQVDILTGRVSITGKLNSTVSTEGEGVQARN